MKAKRQKVIIAFADIRGFGPWARRAEPDEFMSLMSTVYDGFFRFQSSSQCLMKLLADGFLAVIPINQKDEKKEIIRFLQDIYKSVSDINRILKANGLKNLRVRIVVGKAWRVIFKDGGVDYLGYQLNYCQRLLDIGREGEDFLISESSYNALGRNKQRAGLTFKKISIEGASLSGVDAEDLKVVYAFRINGKHKKL